MTSDDLHKKGMAIRRKVLGKEYTECQLENSDEFSESFQRLMTEFAWGSVWSRPGLTLRERSLLTMAMCICMNRSTQLNTHLLGAVRNGCTKLEIHELILHAFVYAGGPAAVEASAVVKKFFETYKPTHNDEATSVSLPQSKDSAV